MSQAKNEHKKSKPKVVEVNAEEMGAIVEKAKMALSPEEHEKLKAAIVTVVFLTEELKKKAISINRLRALLFGPGTEKTDKVLGEGHAGHQETAKAGNGAQVNETGKAKRPGHGRNGAAAYTGAGKGRTQHPSLHGGDPCPECSKGRVYPLSEPEVLVRISGMAPLGATVFENDRLRCNLCGDVF